MSFAAQIVKQMQANKHHIKVVQSTWFHKQWLEVYGLCVTASDAATICSALCWSNASANYLIPPSTPSQMQPAYDQSWFLVPAAAATWVPSSHTAKCWHWYPWGAVWRFAEAAALFMMHTTWQYWLKVKSIWTPHLLGLGLHVTICLDHSSSYFFGGHQGAHICGF